MAVAPPATALALRSCWPIIPRLSADLTREHHLLLQRPAEAGNIAVLETMLAFGFDPNARDKDGVTALHRAAISGHPGATRALITGGADVHAVDGMFSAPPLVWAVEGRGHAAPGADHVHVARLLVAAGSPRAWHPKPDTPSPERTQEGLLELLREADAG
ncbi:MAG: ankyrin repeat domain-containing protein [Gemmatimonadaceae bacterium]